MKKDIVYSGDAVNVTARIEGQCHALDARLLVSEAALALAPLPLEVTAEPVGEADLRGRDGAIRLFRIVEQELRDNGAPSGGPASCVRKTRCFAV